MRTPRALRRLALLLLPAALVAGCAPRHEPARAWTADQVPEAYARPLGALMWPGGTRAFQVTPGGDLYNGVWAVRITACAGDSPAAAPRSIACEDRWLPVLRWTRRGGGVQWDYEAIACPEPEPGPFAPRGLFARMLAARERAADRRAVDALFASLPLQRADQLLARAPLPLERDPLDRRNVLVSLQVTVTNQGIARRAVRSELAIEPAPLDASYRDPDSLLGVPWNTCWLTAVPADSVMGVGAGEVTGHSLVTRFELRPGERRTFRAVLPAYPLRGSSLESWARVSHAERVRSVREYWLRTMDRGATIELPDPEVVHAWRAAAVLLLSLRERRLDAWVPIGGPFHYRDVWLRDGARAMQALAIAGYTREARELAQSFLAFQWPHGPFRSQGGQLDGTGQAMWAFEQVLLRPRPAPDVRRYADAGVRAWRALERARGGARPGGGRGIAGLLPITDPHDAELVEAQLVGNDAWAIAGYRATERLLRAAGENAAADSIGRSELRYRRTFQASLAATGQPDVPPSWQGPGTDWGNLAVGYPCRVLPPDDPRLLAMARRYWAATGGAGLGHYRDPDAAHTYVAADLGTWALVSGHRAIADSVLAASLAWRSAGGGAAEIFSRSKRDFGVNYPPHPTAAAALIALVRNSLLYDDADVLQLTLGARTAWWTGSRVRRAPTRWGLIDLSFAREGREARWSWTPVPVWTALTLPPATHLAGPLPPGCLQGRRGDVVLAPPGRGEVHLTIADGVGS